MKKIALLFSAMVGLASLQSCEFNDEIVQQDIFLAEVFEVTTTFTPGNNYASTFNFSKPSYEGDTVLMYILWEQSNGTDVWRLVPQTVYLTGTDQISYNYDYTRNDFRVFLQGNFNLSQLTNEEYQNYAVNQTFRAVVVPGKLLQGKGVSTVDYSDYNATINALGLQNATIKKLK